MSRLELDNDNNNNSYVAVATATEYTHSFSFVESRESGVETIDCSQKKKKK